MVDTRYNDRMVEHLREQWLLDDRDDDRYDEEDSCCMCRGHATLDICGELYCEDCAKEEFRTYDDDPYCCIGGEDCETDTYYKVANDYFCEDCFLEVFRR